MLPHFQTGRPRSKQTSQEVRRYFAMTCVCVGCGTEVKDKEGKPVEKLYDQVANQTSGRHCLTQFLADPAGKHKHTEAIGVPEVWTSVRSIP